MLDEVGARVKAVQIKSGLTQDAFAHEIGLDGPKFSKSLNGRRRFTSLELSLVAQIASTTVDWLLSGAEPRSLQFAARAAQSSPETEAKGQSILGELGHRFDALKASGYTSAPVFLPERSSSSLYIEQANALAESALVKLAMSMIDSDTPGLISAVEAAFGINITVDSLPAGCDGLSYQDDDFRAIVLATTSKSARQRYTLAHELGHLLWGDASERVIAEEMGSLPAVGDRFQEKRANVFAASFLLPAPEVAKALRGRSADEAFDEMVWRFGVSPTSLAWRLFNLGHINDAGRAALATRTAQDCAGRLGRLAELAGRSGQSATFRAAMPLVTGYLAAYAAGASTLHPVAELLRWDIATAESFFDSPDGDEGLLANPEALS